MRLPFSYKVRLALIWVTAPIVGSLLLYGMVTLIVAKKDRIDQQIESVKQKRTVDNNKLKNFMVVCLSDKDYGDRCDNLWKYGRTDLIKEYKK